VVALREAPTRVWTHRHLLDVDALTRADVERVLALATQMREARGSSAVRELLAREMVGLAFYEGSTRTRVSFEFAARGLGATVVDLAVAASSVAKGESLVDTLRTLERAGVTMLVLRHGASGAPYVAARATGMRIVNAGDGLHAHPTQAVCDMLALRTALGDLAGVTVAIVGDVAHSRVARSNVHALRLAGAKVRVAGPPAFVAGFRSWPGVEVATTIEAALADADAVMTLRIQLERAARSGTPSVPEYVARWGLTEERMALASREAVLLHPGPTNEGIELSSGLANGPRSLIARQVEWGVPVRMAVMALLADAV
jgi:aspartate carbamoyltransferase catalytic subunit